MMMKRRSAQTRLPFGCRVARRAESLFSRAWLVAVLALGGSSLGCESPPTPALQVAAGGRHTCELVSAGVKCWGSNLRGQLGTGNSADLREGPPDETIEIGGTVITLSAGGAHTCALLDTGSVRCWGAGNVGQVGYGNVDNVGDDETPASVGDVDVGGTVVQISAGNAHTCALLDTGNVRCWGAGNFGQLGYGNVDNVGDDETPASVGDVDVGGTVVQISAGLEHTCALLDTGNVRCWGYSPNGNLGYGNTDWIGDDETPASAGDLDIGGRVAQVSAGFFHTCALLDTGNVRCWGMGALGYGNLENIGDDEAPAAAGDVDVGGTVVQIEASRLVTCVILDTGAVRCWGYGRYGALGYGNREDIGDDETPAQAGDVDVGGAVKHLSAEGHVCAILDTGELRCWGEGGAGKLGYGDDESIGNDETPACAGDVPL